MMTVTESTANSMSQPIGYNNYTINRSYLPPPPPPITTYDYRHHHPWEKANYATFDHQSPLFPTGSISSINKSYHPSSSDTIPNLNNTNPNFYRRHTESTLPTSTPYHYSPHPSGLFFGWNNSSSLIRTHSASYQDYPGSPRISQMVSNNPYPPFFNLIPPTNYSLPPLSSSISTKRSIPSKITKRPRLTAHIRSEILKFKATKPTIFVWEIQQNLLHNGICTSQTLPNPTSIQRVLNESLKASIIVKEEPKLHVNLPVSICLSPSPSPSLSNGECSICLESYHSGQEVSILACSHEYHSSCIGEWMLKNRSCPMCRTDIHNQPQFVTLLI